MIKIHKCSQHYIYGQWRNGKVADNYLQRYREPVLLLLQSYSIHITLKHTMAWKDCIIFFSIARSVISVPLKSSDMLALYK